MVVMYSGNMGLGHRFGEVGQLIRRLSEAGGRGKLRFVFFGEGKRKSEVEKLAESYPGCGLEVHGYVDGNLLDAHLRSADLHLVSLDPSWNGTMVPSKLQGIFAAGRPALFIGSRDSSIGRWILESGGGWVVEAGDVDGLEMALVEASDAVERRERGAAAEAYGRSMFSKPANVASIVAVMTA